MDRRIFAATSYAGRPGSVGCTHALGLAILLPVIIHHLPSVVVLLPALELERKLHVGSCAAHREGIADTPALLPAILLRPALT